MSDYDDDFDNDEDNSPAGLRAALKKAQQAAKAAEKRAAEAEERANQAAARAKKSDLADLLKKAGVPEKFAARADKDGAEATEDGVKAWIEENRDFYNFGEAKPAEVVEPEGQDNVSPELRAALAASQALDSAGVTPSEVNIADRIQSISDNVTEEALLAELAALGVQIG